MSDKAKKNWKKEGRQPTDDLFEDEDLMDFADLYKREKEPSTAGLEHPSYPDLEEKLTLAEQKSHDNWEKLTRAMAELENVRRRAERDVANAHKFSLERFANQLLPVVDSLEQALQLADKVENKAMHEGLELTMKLFVDVLQKNQIEQINPDGEPFDPQQHEAMSMQAAPGVAAHTVLVVFQKGYKLHDRVIRPARVIVAKEN